MASSVNSSACSGRRLWMKIVRLLGVEAGGEPVDHHVVDVLLDDLALFVVRGQRVPVGDEVEAVVVVLQPHPVLQRAVVVAEVQRAGGAHAGEDAGSHGVGAVGRKARIVSGRPHWRSAYTAGRHEAHRHPDLRPRLQHGGHRAALRRRGLAGAVVAVIGNRADAAGLAFARGARHRHRGGGPPGATPRARPSMPSWRDASTASRPTWWCWPASCASSAPAFVRRYEGRHAQHPPVAAAGVPGPAHAPARARGRLQGWPAPRCTS